MKVYAIEAPMKNTRYKPFYGWYTAAAAAKKAANQHFKRGDPWQIVSYNVSSTITQAIFVKLLNGDTLHSIEDGAVPIDYLVGRTVPFKNAAMKRYEKELKS